VPLMRANNSLRFHFVNVNHGDAIIVEFPDYGNNASLARFAVVDFGAVTAADRNKLTSYLEHLVEVRRDGDNNFTYRIEFACVTHPHYGGLTRFMRRFVTGAEGNHLDMFWDCGFRTASTTYNRTLETIAGNDEITFVRMAAGAEFEFGAVRVTALGPSIDLRNRFDTYGVNKNNASVVLKFKFGNSTAILSGDAQFDSWAKIGEEFPRMSHITYQEDALGLAERQETSDQLRCGLLKVSHHGSKHGSSLEYLERVAPTRIVYTAGDQQWYQDNRPDWVNDFPHPLVVDIMDELQTSPQRFNTGVNGNLIFSFTGGYVPQDVPVPGDPETAAFRNALTNAWV
jgi:beta-lactamase superfamily II metal-dependent hydrolase